MNFHPYFKNTMREVLSSMIEAARNDLAYYTNRFDPELKEYTGLSVEERRSMAQEQLDNLLDDARLYAECWEKGQCFFEGAVEEVARHLRTIIARHMQEAYAFAEENPKIVYYRFKAAVTALNLLRQFCPQYQTVTARFFIS